MAQRKMQPSAQQISPVTSPFRRTCNLNGKEPEKMIEMSTRPRWLCLPKKPCASRGFMIFKLFLITLFVVLFIYEETLSLSAVIYFRAKVQDLRDSEVWPPRTKIQVESMNGHFFLVSSLLVGVATVLGIFSIMMEDLIMLGFYAWLHFLIVIFEVISAWQSFDEEIIMRKAPTVIPEPVMILLVVYYAHLCRINEQKLAKSPLFKQFMAAKAGKGETMSDPNYQITKDQEATKGGANNNERQVEIIIEEAGRVNEALDLTLDSEGSSKSGDTNEPR